MSDLESSLVKQFRTMSNNLAKFQKPGRKYDAQEEAAFKEFFQNFQSFLRMNNLNFNEYQLDNPYTPDQLNDKMKPITAQLAREEALREAKIKKPQKDAETPQERRNYEDEKEAYERALEKEMEEEERTRAELAEMRAKQSRLLMQETEEAIARLPSETLTKTSAMDVLKAKAYKNRELDYMSSEFDIRSYQTKTLEMDMHQDD